MSWINYYNPVYFILVLKYLYPFCPKLICRLLITKCFFNRADVKNDEMIGVDVNDNKPEPEDATHDKVDDFNEDTCDLCIYDFLTFENY